MPLATTPPPDARTDPAPRRIEILPLPFRIGTADRLRAAMGLPAWMVRRKRLERTLRQLRAELATAHAGSDPESWPLRAQAWDLSAIRREIESFNKYFPMERNLPMDPRIRDYVEGGERFVPLPLPDTAWILAEYPPEAAGAPSARTP